MHNQTRHIKKSKKAHTCDNCSLVIPKGSAYVINVGKYLGDFYNVKSHYECEEEYWKFNQGEHEWYPLSEWDGLPELQEQIREKYPQPLTDEEIEIMKHTDKRAAHNLYCGDSKAMRSLVKKGFMRSAGFKSFVPSEYFTLTEQGWFTLGNIRRSEQ